MDLTRRHFVGFGTLLTASTGLGFAGLRRGASTVRAEATQALVPDPQGIIDLPPGCSYTVLQKAGDTLSDGALLRGAVDGMAAFAGEPGQVVLMRNHELSAPLGGVSRVVVDLATLTVISSNDVLTGTSRNCAGGPSPWGWLSCEEVVDGRVWLCPTTVTSVLTGDERGAIDAYGTFKHEAVCIDPDGLVAYLTEDDGESHLYRMVPSDPAADPFAGRLQALKVVGSDGFDTATMTIDESVEVEWVEVSPSTARADAKAQHAAIVWRGEGVWWFEGAVYFTATSNNQVFELIPSTTGGTLRLIANDIKAPDNITVAPWGELFVAEDHDGVCRIRVVNAAGEVREFARNALSSAQEFAGLCFSPDGKVLFVNMQWSGHTLAITGPFERELPDAGVAVDAAVPVADGGELDAGSPDRDGGAPRDAGQQGPRDDGGEADPDARPSEDAGSDADGETKSQGCALNPSRQSGRLALLFGALAAVLLRSRRAL